MLMLLSASSQRPMFSVMRFSNTHDDGTRDSDFTITESLPIEVVVIIINLTIVESEIDVVIMLMRRVWFVVDLADKVEE
jgi:hypothetical protein